jgi:hypothetical protein
MKKIIARLMSATERIVGVVKEEAAQSRQRGLGLAADELDLLAEAIEQRRGEYRDGLKLVKSEPAGRKETA